VSHDSLDDTHILNRWIAGHADHPAVTVLDQSRVHDRDYWKSVHDQALTVPDDALVLEVTGVQATLHAAHAGDAEAPGP
jgi:hypothetical protein